VVVRVQAKAVAGVDTRAVAGGHKGNQKSSHKGERKSDCKHGRKNGRNGELSIPQWIVAFASYFYLTVLDLLFAFSVLACQPNGYAQYYCYFSHKAGCD